MKKLIFLLLILPSVLFAQTPDSWVNFTVQYDSWAPQESNWFMVEDTVNGDTAIFHQPTTAYQYLDTTININSGNYVITLNDSYGDGWNSNNPAWFKMQNDCQGLILNYDPLTAVFFTLDTLVNILPCAPPISGCTNPTALNYDSLATSDDGSCQFIIGCMDPTALNYDPTAGTNDYTGPVAGGATCNTTQWSTNVNYFGVDLTYAYANASIFSIGTEISVNGYSYFIDGVSVPNNCNQGVVLMYVVHDQASCDGDPYQTYQPGALYDDILVGDIWSINPCQYIYGCNDPLAINYDPTATTDDGSCDLVTGCMDSTAVNYNPAAVAEGGYNVCTYATIDTTGCGVDSVELIVTIMLDQYGGETSWWIQNNQGTTIAEVLTGAYSNLPMGTIVSQSTCVADNTPITFRIEDSFGDGLGGGAWGGIDGTWMVHTPCDTIGNGGGNFGSGEVVNGNVGDCDDLPIEGCMDDTYLEFNIDAVIDDGSCSTLNIYGCIDTNSINYDSLANTQEQFSNCSHTLNLTDLSANGWGGSFLMVSQGNTSYGPFSVSSGAGFTTQLNLNSNELVKAFFYSDPLSANFSDECGFEIVSPTGEIIVFGGDNPFLNPIQLSPYMYSGIAKCLSTCIPIVNGCTDILACNYDSLANTLSTCTYNIQYYDCNNICLSDIDADGICDELEIPGCQDPLMYNYNILATDDDGSCEPYVYGCTDGTMWNYDILANTDNGSCIPFIYGCTDSTQFNYDQLANTDNGSCYPIILGCNDSTSLNFNPLANTDDATCIAYLYGCTDSTATNYNAIANTDDGTCIATVLGCTSPIAFNYNILATTDDGSCLPFIYGCMDASQFNYNITANTEDSTCIPFIYGCMDATQFNYDITANTSNGSCLPYVYGCIDSTMFNYNPLANTTNNSCIPFIYGCTDSTAINYNALANTTDNSCIAFIYGCIDSTATNYNALANTDDGTCIATILGCTDPIAFNYNPLANTNDGCIPFIYGCTDNTMFNYNATANADDGNCIPFTYGCTDNTMFNYNALANSDNGSCIPFINGCTDSTAFNYNPLANTDNGTCDSIVLGCTDPAALNYDPLANTNDNSCITPIYGCTDSTAWNYNPLANTDNNTCEPFIYGCTNPNALNYDVTANTDDNSCILPINGCMDSTMFNYNPLANVDNGSCTPFVYGCNDATALNFNPLANTSDNSCCYISGCMDITALNYDPNACFEPINSCITIISGCTDVAAYNYNPAANVSDSTACNYDAGCYGGPGIPFWLNDGCYAWVIDVDDYCCTTDWDASCIQMYDYCQLGWPTAIEDISALGIVVYPNPTKDIISIETRLDIEVEVYDIMGKLLINKESKRIDLSNYPNGVYNLILIYNNKRFTTRLIKQ